MARNLPPITGAENLSPFRREFFNIAEGAGEYAVDEKARFYRMAKRSATECAGILDVCQRLQLVEENRYIKGRELLIGIVSMLIKMAQKQR